MIQGRARCLGKTQPCKMLTKILVISHNILTSTVRINFQEIADKIPVKNLAISLHNSCKFTRQETTVVLAKNPEKYLVVTFHILTSALRTIFQEIAGKIPVKNLAISLHISCKFTRQETTMNLAKNPVKNHVVSFHILTSALRIIFQDVAGKILCQESCHILARFMQVYWARNSLRIL